MYAMQPPKYLAPDSGAGSVRNADDPGLAQRVADQAHPGLTGVEGQVQGADPQAKSRKVDPDMEGVEVIWDQLMNL